LPEKPLFAVQKQSESFINAAVDGCDGVGEIAPEMHVVTSRAHLSNGWLRRDAAVLVHGLGLVVG